MTARRDLAFRLVVDPKGAITAIDATGKKLDNLKLKFQGAAKGMDTTAKQVVQSTNKMNSSLGLAGATVNSFAQGLSDIPFGLRGVANNIGQVATMFGMLTATTGGVTNALKSMWAAMKGPLGIIVAIQGVLAGLQIWEQRAQKAKRAIKEQNDAVTSSVVELNVLIATLKNANLTEGQRSKVIDDINKKYNLTLKNMKSEEEIVKVLEASYEDIVKALQRKQALQAAEEQLIPIYQEILDIQEQLRLEEKAQNQQKNLSIDAEERLMLLNLQNQQQTGEAMVEEGKLAELEQNRTDQLKLSLAQLKLEANKLLSGLTGVFSEDQSVAEKTKDKMEIITVETKAGLDRIQSDMDKFIKDQEGGYNTWNEQYRKVMQERKLITTNFAEVEKDQQERTRKRLQMDLALRQEILSTGLQSLTAITNLFFKTGEKQSRQQFEFQKKFNIATTLIDTFLSAQAAYKSQILIPDPSAPIRAAVAAASAIASGLARVNAIRQQQFNAPSIDIGGGAVRGGSTIGGGFQPPTTGFTNIRSGLTPEQELRVYVLDRDIRDVGNRNDNQKKKAIVK